MEPAIIEQSSDKLKEFYKKLVQTDSMIKNLRKLKFNNPNNEYNINYENKPDESRPDRFKRSLKVFTYPKKYRVKRRFRNAYNRTSNLNHQPGSNNKLRIKRFGNETEQPTGFVIEKKKLIVQYKPLGTRKLVPKCSHVPKESHIHHEHQLKHPFYQNTQRLDELLDRFLNNNLPEIVADPFGFDSLFQNEKNKCKHIVPHKNVNIVNMDSSGNTAFVKENKQKTATTGAKSKSKTVNEKLIKSTVPHKHTTPNNITHKAVTKIKHAKTNKVANIADNLFKDKKIFYKFDSPEISKLLGPLGSTPYERKFYEHEADMLNKEENTLITASPSDFELLLSVSTIMNPDIGQTVGTVESEPLINRVPNIRRLMQMDGEKEENLGYEDFKEVLTDHMENEDDNERRRGERRKRNQDLEKDKNNEIQSTTAEPTLDLPEGKGKPQPEVTLSAEWSSITAHTTPISEVYQKERQFNPPSAVNNPNWKGAMPLYPDELSSMLKDKPDANKENILNQRLDVQPSSRIKRGRSDFEYVEDYLNSKYNRLVEMAQAYSDYGVLEGKKDNLRNEKHPATNNKISGERVKLSVDETLFNRGDVALRQAQESIYYPFCINKDTTPTTTSIGGIFRLIHPHDASKQPSNRQEGFKFELRPTPHGGIGDSLISRLLQSHIKLDSPKKKPEEFPITQVTPISFYPQTHLIYNSKLDLEEETKKKESSGEEPNIIPNILFTPNKKRVLLSTLFRDSYYNDPQDNLRQTILDSSSENDQNINNYNLDKTMKYEYKRDSKVPKPNKLKKVIKNKNRYLKNVVTEYNSDDSYGNTDHSMLFLKPDNSMNVGSVAKEIMNYLSQLTDYNIRLFSAPYLYPLTQEKSTIAPLTTTAEPNLNLYETDSNITNDLDQPYQVTNQLNLNPSDITQLTEYTEMKPMDTDQARFQPQLFMSSQHAYNGISETATNEQNLNPSDITQLTEYTEMKPMDTDQASFQPQLFMSSQHAYNGISETATNEQNLNPSDITQLTEYTERKQMDTDQASFQPQLFMSSQHAYHGISETATNKLNLNPSDITQLSEYTEMKPMDIDEASFQPQIFMSSQDPHHGTSEMKDQSETTFNVNFNAKTSATTDLLEETTRSAEDNLQVPERVKRFKRNVGTAKTMLEKSDVTIHESSLGLTEIHKNISDINTQMTSKFPINKESNITMNTTANNITLSDFFMMISNWFTALEGFKVDHNPRDKSGSDLTQLLLQFSQYANETKQQNTSSTTDIAYPLYDSDMIENIGHRSRVLLTIKEENATESSGRLGLDNNEVIKETSANISGRVSESSNSASLSTTTIHVSINDTITEKHNTEKHIATLLSVSKEDNNTRKKVKRNAEDSNLISWNDIYDDEYGIRTDNFNNVVKDRSSKERDFIKRSGRWVQNKIKKFADNLKGHDPEVVVKKRTSRTADNVGFIEKLKELYRKTKRQSDVEDLNTDQKTIFNNLQANMVEVCRKAANAVKKTRNADGANGYLGTAKEATEQGTLAAALMQQLVRLLTDVVDYQVEQKTCSQLPPELKEFLEWLTKPEEDLTGERIESSIDDHPEAIVYKTTPSYSEEYAMEELIKVDKTTEHTSTTENMAPEPKEPDYKSQYLEALRSVQELIDQFEKMSDDEKSKMTGVKMYLENQLRHLNKQVSGYDFYNLYEKINLPLRYKRGFRPRSFKQRSKRKHYKFVRNFGKKHTRTTAAYYDGIPVSEKKMNPHADKLVENKQNKRFKLTVPKRAERNLKDVYYKAVAEAKKYSTALAKNGHKKQAVPDFTLTTRLDLP